MNNEYGIFHIKNWKNFYSFLENKNIIKNKKSEIPNGAGFIKNPTDNQSLFWRGHLKPDYKLSSTLERRVQSEIDRKNESNRNEISKDVFLRMEVEYLDICKKLFRGKIAEQSILLNSDFDNEIWAMGQHYGLATPLLDWTESFFVALYFAFEAEKPNDKKHKYRAVFCLDTSWLGSDNIDIFRPKIDLGGRISAQKGVFTKVLSCEFDKLNRNAKERNEKSGIGSLPVSKILISEFLRQDILEYLLSINVSGATLFPDIYGAIRDCHLELENILNAFEY